MLNKLIGQTGRHSKGSTLIMVLIVFAVLMLLGTAVLTASTVSTNVTAATAKKQQADLIAQSAAKAAVAYILGNTNIQLALSSLTVGSSMQGGANFGSRGTTKSLTVTAISATVYKVTVTTSYNNVNGQAVVYLTKSGSAANQGSPSQYLFYTGGGVSGGNMHSSNSGNILSYGSYTVTEGKNSGILMVGGPNSTATLDNNSGVEVGSVVSAYNVDIQGQTVDKDVVAGNTVLSHNNSNSIGGSIYCHGGIDFYGLKVAGNVKTNGTFYNENVSGSIGGSLYADGTVTLNGGMTIQNDVYAYQDVKMPNNSSGTINGSIYANGDVTFIAQTLQHDIKSGGNVTVNGGTIEGNVYVANANKTFTMTGGTIDGNVYLNGGSAAYSKSGGTIVGNVYYNCTNTVGVAKLPTISVNYQPVSFSNPVLPPEAVAAENTTVAVSNNTITQSGVLNPSIFSTGNMYNINTTVNQKPIYLFVNSSVSLTNGTSFEVSGSNNVYFVLGNSVQYFQATQNSNNCNSYIGPAVVTDPTNVFILGGYQDGSGNNIVQNVSIDAGSCFNAFIYIPNGTFAIGNNNGSGLYNRNGITCTNVFTGSIVANGFNIQTNSKNVAYYNINVAGTPLSSVTGGSVSVTGVDSSSPIVAATSNNTPTSGSWAISGWAAS